MATCKSSFFTLMISLAVILLTFSSRPLAQETSVDISEKDLGHSTAVKSAVADEDFPAITSENMIVPLPRSVVPFRKAAYVGLHLGGSSMDVKQKANLYESKAAHRLAVRFSLGYRFSPYYRTEFAVAGLGSMQQIYTSDAHYKWSGKAYLSTLMVNNYLHYPLQNERLSPYIGLGLGVLRLMGEGKKPPEDNDQTTYKIRSSSFAYQLIGGIDVAIVKNVVAGLDVRYTQGKLKLSAINAQKNTTLVGITEVSLGAKLFF